VYVSESAALSSDGLAESILELQGNDEDRVAEGLPPLVVLGIVINKMRGTRSQRARLAQLKQYELKQRLPGPLLQVLSLRTVWEEAAEHQQSIFSYGPQSGEALDANDLVDATERRLLEWLTGAI
jgi:cellulose biosynthesis protein BcsQ